MTIRPTAAIHQDSGAFRLPWLGMAAVVLACAGLLVASRREVVRLVSLSSLPRTQPSSTLKIAPVGDSLQIEWPAGARSGVLSIQDGDTRRRFVLSDNDLAHGLFNYRCSSPDVLVRLETDGRTESAWVLGQPEVAMAAAKPSPAPPVENLPAADPESGTADRAATPAVPVSQPKVNIVPEPLPRALRSVRGIIRVDVRVATAPDGSAQSAALATAANSRYFDRLSLQAAQQSRFDASATGASHTLRYQFTRAGVQVSEIQRP